MKIIVTQFWTNNLSYGKYTKAINENYCIEKNYIYHIETDTNKILNGLNGRSYTWYKPKLIMEVLDTYNPDYVLFLDADAIVSDKSYKIEDFLVEGYDCIVTEDYGPSVMNGGVILFKNTEWTKMFLQKWWEISEELMGPNGEPVGYFNRALWHDQTCFGHLYNNNSDYRSKIKILNNEILNGRIFKDFHNKNFIFHAFSYGMVPNRTIDTAYYNIFNLPKPEGDYLIDIVGNYNTDKHYEHNYFNLIYNELFKEKQLEIKTFIEVGIDKGGSLELWRDYFKNAEIIGLDINLDMAKKYIGDDNLNRITLKNLNQSDENQLVEFSKKYENVDVILDDGSHKMFDQQITFAKLFKMLKSGGVYIIEDLHTSLEVVMPEKSIFGWGDPNKTITLNMLKNYQKNNEIISDYMTKEEMEYLNENIQSIDIYQSRIDWSVTSVIIKK
jgi:hypothetical protein